MHMTTDVAIIGAGIAGTYCAHLLSSQGRQITVIEKSRGTGGRASSKRLVDGGSCDMGAPFFQLNTDHWQSQIQTWLNDGVIAPYQTESNKNDTELFYGTPKISAFSRYLLDKNTLINQTKVQHLEKSEMGWVLKDENYNIITECRTLIITAPAAQSSQLLASTKTVQQWLLEAQAATELCQPQWSLLVESDYLNAKEEQLENLVYAITQTFEKSDVIDRVIHDSAKQGREHKNKWVIQATCEWSQKHINMSSDNIAQLLLAEFTKEAKEHIGTTRFSVIHIHRWLLGRHQPVESQIQYFLDDNKEQITETYYRWNNELQLGLAADWLCQGDIEGALSSAKELSAKILTQKC